MRAQSLSPPLADQLEKGFVRFRLVHGHENGLSVAMV
jgi:hypothetical protein